MEASSSSTADGIHPISSSDIDLQKIYKWTTTESEGTALHRSNWDEHIFHETLGTIFRMSRLPANHDMFLPPNIAKRATDILAAILNGSTISPPQVLNEERDTLLLTWFSDGVKSYLCIDEDEVELETRKLGTAYSCSSVILEDGDMNMDKVLRAIGGQQKTATKA
ncbi:hypothetical protein [uncultured Salipiger sp.]|uniref:hypothetical protein n=1 Tax=uncultured Salipiger sp. TaxID=499810 RepID=UPI0025954E00|nr:hypothetical protein [uncultured Salipiger sp.]